MSAIGVKSSNASLATFVRAARSSRIPYYLLAGGVAAAAYATYDNNNRNNYNNNGKGVSKAFLPLIGGGAAINSAVVPDGKSFADYQKLYNAIAAKVQENDDFDNGAGMYGILCRLAWHTSGTFDKKAGTGGSFNGTMIYGPEQTDPENAGLATARDFLVEFKETFPWISRGDLWTLGGVVAVQESGGPKIPWRPGRVDTTDRSKVVPNGNLPDATRDGKYVKNLFNRMGFNERETVALLGAHCLGQCHKHSSGFDGKWVPAFNMFTNDFYVRLLGDWYPKTIEETGRKQFEDSETKSLMMLPTDMALKEEPYFLKYVKEYAADQDLFFKDFADAFSRLLEGGINYPKTSEKFYFKTLEEQE